MTVCTLRSACAAPLGGQQDEERLRGGDENVRRVLDHLLAFGRRRVAGAHGRADRRQQQSALGCDASRCPTAEHRDSCGCRCSAPSAARRTAPASCRAGCRRGPRGPGHRGKSEMPRASCPTRSAPKSARSHRNGSRATRAPAARSPQPKCCANQSRTIG